MKQETLEEAAEKYAESKDSSSIFKKVHKKDFINGGKWYEKTSNINALHFEIFSLKKEIKVLKDKQERLCDSEVIQKIRATLSDAEVRRIIRNI